MKHAEKRIAKIYFDAKVFITKQGELYGYQLHDGKPRCHKLGPEEKIVFWDYLTSSQNETLIPWRPVAQKMPPMLRAKILAGRALHKELG